MLVTTLSARMPNGHLFVTEVPVGIEEQISQLARQLGVERVLVIRRLAERTAVDPWNGRRKAVKHWLQQCRIQGKLL